MKRSSWHLRAGSVVLGWLVALVMAAIAHPYIALSNWLLIHLLGLGAASNAILIWSRHFADALLRRSPDPPYPGQVIRLLAFNIGAVTVITGMLGGWWPVVLAGGVLVAAVAAVHAGDLMRFLRAALPARFSITVHYYVAAAACLAVGAGLGVAMANSALPGILAERFRTAHAVLNLFGWVGLTVLGTLVTLWPTMLRTRMADGVERAARRGLPALVLSVAVAVAGAILGSSRVVGVGALSFLTAVGFVLWPHIDEVRRKRPADFPTLSVLCGVVWLAGSLGYLSVGLLTAPNSMAAATVTAAAGPALLAGFLVQVLFGSLAYLIPMVVGGRASALAATAELERGAPWRLSVANFGLLICVLPVPNLVRVAVSALVLVAYGAFLPLLVRAVWLAQRNTGVRSTPGRLDPPPLRQRLGIAAAGFGVVILTAAAGVAADPATLGIGSAPTVTAAPTGHTTEVRVRVDGMRYVPDTITVPAGDRLRITFHNTGTDRHDLVLANGARTDRVAPGVTAVLDAGVIGSDLAGWCSIAGHRQMGMTLTIKAIGTPPVSGHEHELPGHGPDPSLTATDIARSLGGRPGPGFAARDLKLSAAETAEHRVTLTVSEVEREVSPGITQRLWTFGGSAPGPTLRGRVGDVFEITLINDGTIGHSIDFHAGSLAPDRPMRTIEPGAQLVYRFTATRAGVWLYHCATMPMSVHIANGMFGAVVIDPPDLSTVDREYLMVQSEFYLGADGGEVDADKVAADTPDLVVFNGYAQQYDHAPLTARVGERVRIWVLAAGPNRGSAFHVVGGQFDTVWAEGAYRLRPGAGGSQTLGLFPAQGGFVELSFPEPGNYPFVSHAMVDAERGAHGVIAVGN
ncbi:multicopper oxidase domain-containing protein [Mycolicibacterium gilvum]|uniref:Copper-containing nitrite reductase n=1 Tax=Mycolicibacterium gilvum (strain DSM 45189 / LMG 24558 / Spyr1) TaxID=278137 RepID=E6TN96_MYCSR|nr:multicopper oxidase domain-containing protein [Mycolicibacterium gilvum]ADT99454.1 predicted multicopper oxidase [Mycolicibacterium gilvum Spyr1]